MIGCLLILLAYLYGSIPFALVIGKVFYKTDIRKYGSGNLGGSNAGRILGKKVGFLVIALDVTKCFIVVEIVKLITTYFNLNHDIVYLSGLFCAIGHCYPVFANFKGGKAVSVMFGYMAALNIPITLGIFIFFLVILKITKYVSLSSILASLLFVCISPWLHPSTIGFCCNIGISILLIYRHHENIKRIINHNERKITWM